MSEEDKVRLFKQIGALVLAGVSLEDCAKLLEVDEEKLKQIISLDAYKLVERDMLEERVLRESRFNDGWDDIEKKSIRIVNQSLDSSRDGEFALRAAVVANRARRRGPNANGVINSTQGVRASVALPVSFVAKIKGRNGELTLAAEIGGEAKVPQQKIDCLQPGQVENLFGSATGGGNSKDMLEGIDF